jgi:hypothetical protein
MAIIDEQGKGPQFGPEGLKVCAALRLHVAMRTQAPHAPVRCRGQVSLDTRSARSRLGTYYERRRDGSRTLFTEAEGGAAAVVSLRAWVGVGVAPGTEGYTPNLLQWQPGELEKLREQDTQG